MNDHQDPDAIALTLRPSTARKAATSYAVKARRYRGLTYRQASRIDRARRATRLTSALQPVRRVSPTRRPGGVVARHRVAGSKAPAAGGDDGQPGEPADIARAGC